jgi:hypothetical protein
MVHRPKPPPHMRKVKEEEERKKLEVLERKEK